MRLLLAGLLPLATLLVTVSAPLATVRAAPPPPAQPMSWALWPTPAAGVYLAGVTAISPSDVWAVGDTNNGGTLATLSEQWNGSAWSVVSSANTGTSDYFTSVAAVSPSDVWAVGDYSKTCCDANTLTEHWNGTSWSVEPSPAGAADVLSGVAAVSSSDVWAVGGRAPGQALIEQWNGTAWSEISSPSVGTSNSLSAVAAISANDVWAVGYSSNGTLTEHWNGTAWSVVPSSSAGYFSSVAAVSSSDVWAIGSYANMSGISQTLVDHWNGTAWSVVPSPNVGALGDLLDSVTAVSADDVWAVGYSYADTCMGQFCAWQTLIEHWNGTTWSVAPSPNYCISSNHPDPCAQDQLYGVAASSARNVWAVGYGPSFGGSLIERYGYSLDAFTRNRAGAGPR